MLKNLRLTNCAAALLGSAIVAFGLYNVHNFSGVTEGGIPGLNLLLEYWFGISPAITNLAATIISYAIGWKLIGREFMLYSAVAVCGFSAAYAICEQFPPCCPEIHEMPLAAALIGALFVGIGTGICIRAGGAVSGDDAIAMCIVHITRVRIELVYLASDLLILLLSLSYIPFRKIGYSLLTVILSGQIIGIMQRIKKKTPPAKPGENTPEHTTNA